MARTKRTTITAAAAPAAPEKELETTTAAVVEETAAAAKKAPAAKKTPATRTRKTVSVNLQYAGKDVSTDALTEQAIQAWAAETNQPKTAAKDIQLYVKPEEDMVYYVINGEAGSFAL